MHKAIIIDDEPHAITLLELCLRDLYPAIQVSKTCTNWQDALQALREGRYDLVFMDVMMPGRNGIELIRLLPHLQGDIIFVTAHEEYALEAFKCYAAGYLLKPVDEFELNGLLSRLLDGKAGQKSIIAGQTARRLLGIPGIKGIDYVRTDDILYLQADHKCTKVVLAEKVYYSSYHLGMFREYLNAALFFPVHRSYIVKLSAVQRYVSSNACLVMKDGSEIPVAKSMRTELLKQFHTLSRPGD